MAKINFISVITILILFLLTASSYAGTGVVISCRNCDYTNKLYFGRGMILDGKKPEEMTQGYCKNCKKFVANKMKVEMVETGETRDYSGAKPIIKKDYEEQQVDNDTCPLCGRKLILVLTSENIEQKIKEISCPKCNKLTLFCSSWSDWD